MYGIQTNVGGFVHYGYCFQTEAVFWKQINEAIPSLDILLSHCSYRMAVVLLAQPNLNVFHGFCLPDWPNFCPTDSGIESILTLSKTLYPITQHIFLLNNF